MRVIPTQLRQLQPITCILSILLLLFTLTGCPQKPPPPEQKNQAQTETLSQQTELEPDSATKEETTATPSAPSTQPTSPPAQPETATSPALPKLWDFWAAWCPPCRDQKPIVEELAKEYAGVIEIKSIDIDANQDLAKQFGISAIPTLIFLDAQGKELTRRVGFYPKDSILARFRSLGFIK